MISSCVEGRGMVWSVSPCAILFATTAISDTRPVMERAMATLITNKSTKAPTVLNRMVTWVLRTFACAATERSDNNLRSSSCMAPITTRMSSMIVFPLFVRTTSNAASNPTPFRNSIVSRSSASFFSIRGITRSSLPCWPGLSLVKPLTSS